MNYNRIMYLNQWIRRRRLQLVMLLSLSVMFNSVAVFASTVQMTHHHSTAMNMAADPHTTHPTSPASQHQNCCDDNACDCSLHCTPSLLPPLLSRLKHALSPPPLPLAQAAHLQQVYPPPQRPPQV